MCAVKIVFLREDAVMKLYAIIEAVRTRRGGERSEAWRECAPGCGFQNFQQLAGGDAGQVQHEKTYRYVKYEAQQRGRSDKFWDSSFNRSSPALIHFHIGLEPSLFQRA